MRKRLEAARATYENYIKWYNKYAGSVEMSTSAFSEKEFQKIYHDAKYAQSKITDPTDRKNFMRNFSQVVARKQRRASELQLRATWTAVKETNVFLRENIKRTEEAYVKELIRKRVVNGRRNLNAKQLKAVEEEVERMFAAGASEEILAKAKKMVASKKAKEINLVETYKDLTYKTFRGKQREILTKYREGVGDRSIWNDAFAIYYERQMRKGA